MKQLIEEQDPMKQMECYTTQNHLKECESCGNLQNGSIIKVDKDNNCILCKRKVGGNVENWKQIEEKYKKLVKEFSLKLINDIEFNVIDDTLAFFKPYFQEKLHQEAKEELENIK